jgi:hypothetical protein
MTPDEQRRYWRDLKRNQRANQKRVDYMPKNPAYMNQDERAAYRSEAAERARAWREANKAYAADYQRAKRAKAKAQEKPERGYHLTECSGKCPFWTRCVDWRERANDAMLRRDELSGTQINHLMRPLPCQAE